MHRSRTNLFASSGNNAFCAFLCFFAFLFELYTSVLAAQLVFHASADIKTPYSVSQPTDLKNRDTYLRKSGLELESE